MLFCNYFTTSIMFLEELRASTPSPVVSEDRDLYNLSNLTVKNTSPKLMANHEIIKSLLTKGEKPKLQQLINEHGNTHKDTECENGSKVILESATAVSEDPANNKEGLFILNNTKFMFYSEQFI